MNSIKPTSLTVDSTKDWSFDGLLKSHSNFKPVKRVHYSRLKEDPTLLQVEANPIPIVIEGWHQHPAWSTDEFSLRSFIDKSPAEISVRNVRTWSDHEMKLQTFIDKCRATPTYAVANETERLYGKDAETPQEWKDWLKSGKAVPEAIAPEGSTDLLRFRPSNDGIHTLMCYVGIGDTFTPCHKDLCASTGHNLMAFTENGGSSFWFMVEGRLAGKVADYFHKLGQELDHENHVVTLSQWGNAPFDVYILEQKLGDLVLVPPRSCHQVVNYGGISLKMSWSRLTSTGLSIGYYHELPLYRRVCRKETYRIKGTLYHAIRGLVQKLGTAQRGSSSREDLAHLNTLRELMNIYDSVLIEDKTPTGITPYCDTLAIETSPEFPCDFCGTDIFQSFFECDKCAHGPDEAPYTICAWCYVEGRSCLCRVMVPKEVRPYKDLLGLRTQAIEVVERVGGTPYDAHELRSTAHADTVFNTACIVHQMLQEEEAARGQWYAAKPKNQRRCLVDRLRNGGESHSILVSAFAKCKPCHFGLCFEHVITVYKMHALEALSLMSTDPTHRSYHERHKKTRDRPYFQELNKKIPEYQSLGTPPPLHMQLSYNALKFTRSRPQVPEKSVGGFYDNLQPSSIHLAPSVDEEVPETVAESPSERNLFSRGSSPLSSLSDDTAPNHRNFEVLPRDALLPNRRPFVDVPLAPYRFSRGQKSGAVPRLESRSLGPRGSPPMLSLHGVKIGPPRSQRKGKQKEKSRARSPDGSASEASSDSEGVAGNGLESDLVAAYSQVHKQPTKEKPAQPNGASTSRKALPKVVPAKRPAPESSTAALSSKRRPPATGLAADKPKGSSSNIPPRSPVPKTATKRRVVNSSPPSSPPPSKVAKRAVISPEAVQPSLSSSSSSSSLSLPLSRPNDKKLLPQPSTSSLKRPATTNPTTASNNKTNPSASRSSADTVPNLPTTASKNPIRTGVNTQPSQPGQRSLVRPSKSPLSMAPVSQTPSFAKPKTFSLAKLKFSKKPVQLPPPPDQPQTSESSPLSSTPGQVPTSFDAAAAAAPPTQSGAQEVSPTLSDPAPPSAQPVASPNVPPPVERLQEVVSTPSNPVPPSVQPVASAVQSPTQGRPPESPAPTRLTSHVPDPSPLDVPGATAIPVYHEDRQFLRLAVDDWMSADDATSATQVQDDTPTDKFAHLSHGGQAMPHQQPEMFDPLFVDAVANRLYELFMTTNAASPPPQTNVIVQLLSQLASSGALNQLPHLQPFPVGPYFGNPNFPGSPFAPGPSPAWGNGFYHLGPPEEAQGWGTGHFPPSSMQGSQTNRPPDNAAMQDAGNMAVMIPGQHQRSTTYHARPIAGPSFTGSGPMYPPGPSFATANGPHRYPPHFQPHFPLGHVANQRAPGGGDRVAPHQSGSNPALEVAQERFAWGLLDANGQAELARLDWQAKQAKHVHGSQQRKTGVRSHSAPLADKRSATVEETHADGGSNQARNVEKEAERELQDSATRLLASLGSANEPVVEGATNHQSQHQEATEDALSKRVNDPSGPSSSGNEPSESGRDGRKPDLPISPSRWDVRPPPRESTSKPSEDTRRIANLAPSGLSYSQPVYPSRSRSYDRSYTSRSRSRSPTSRSRTPLSYSRSRSPRPRSSRSPYSSQPRTRSTSPRPVSRLPRRRSYSPSPSFSPPIHTPTPPYHAPDVNAPWRQPGSYRGQGGGFTRGGRPGPGWVGGRGRGHGYQPSGQRANWRQNHGQYYPHARWDNNRADYPVTNARWNDVGSSGQWTR